MADVTLVPARRYSARFARQCGTSASTAGRGKEGKLYLIDRDNMGKSDPGYDRLGICRAAAPIMWCKPWQAPDRIAQHADGGQCRIGGCSPIGAFPDARLWRQSQIYSIANGLMTLSTTANDLSYGNLSGLPTLSQNVTANSIVWALDRNTNTLRAYDATDLTKVFIPRKLL